MRFDRCDFTWKSCDTSVCNCDGLTFGGDRSENVSGYTDNDIIKALGEMPDGPALMSASAAAPTWL